MTMSGCPVDLDERIELYCLNRLSRGDARRFEAHLATCPPCFFEAKETEFFLNALVGALREIEIEKQVVPEPKTSKNASNHQLRAVVFREEWVLTSEKIQATKNAIYWTSKIARQLRRG